MIDRVSRTTIDHEGKHVASTGVYSHYDVEFCYEADAQGELKLVSSKSTLVPTSQITAAANAAGFYGDDATRFAREVDNATEFLIGRVAASGGDKRRFRDRRSRARLREECLRQAGVPKEYWPPEGLWGKLGRAVVIGIKVALTWSKYSVPLPWNIVIAAVVLAVERYLGGQS